MSSPCILVIGANGQIGSELVEALALRHGAQAVISSDIAAQARRETQRLGVRHVALDATDASALQAVVERFGVTQIYLLAAALSARAEQQPVWAWDLNMKSLLNVLELARTHGLRVFWPSSIAAFGPSSPKVLTPQTTAMDPSSVYGISKLAGEGWCAWYHRTHGVDVRSLRYPGLISWKTPPGGGTTDYAVEIFHAALQTGHYTSFLAADTALPMMYMPDAIRATLELMDAPNEQVRQRGLLALPPCGGVVQAQRRGEAGKFEMVDQLAKLLKGAAGASRAIVDAIHSGALDKVATVDDPVFGVAVPTSCPGVPSEVLVPRNTWVDPAAFDIQAKKVAHLVARRR